MWYYFSDGGMSALRPDDEVIVSILGGDTEAFAELVRRYQRTACAVAASVLGDRHLAEDAAQEAFVVAFQHLADLNDHSAFPSWLIQISRRQALRLNTKRMPEQPLEGHTEPVTPGNDARLNEDALALLDRVMRLPEHERTVTMLHHFDGHSVQAVADMTGRPLGTVTKQLSRAYERLRRTIKEAPKS